MRPSRLRLAPAAALLLGCAHPSSGVPGEVAANAAPTATPQARAATAAPPTPVPTPSPGPSRPWVDLHVDTISRAIAEGRDMATDPALEASFDRLDEAGVGLVVEAVWVPGPNRAPDPHAYALATLAELRRRIDAMPDRARLVLGPADLDALRHDPQVGVLLALEGGQALRSAADVALFAQQGIRMIGLTWSLSNALCGSTGDRPPPGPGLTDLGREVVSEMNRLGLAVDVSHASDACIADVLGASAAPVLASHSNARAITDVPRNLPDDALLAIAEGGGLVGAMFHAPFVAPGATRGDVVGHVLHLGAVMGFDHVGIGTDFDGSIVTPAGLATASDLPALGADLAAAGLDGAELTQVQGAAARAYLRRVWDAAAVPPSGP